MALEVSENRYEKNASENTLLTNFDPLDTRTTQIDDILSAKLEQAFHKMTSHVLIHDLAKIASEHDPIDLAHAATRLPPTERPILYENLPDMNAKVIFMIHAKRSTHVAIFRHIDDKEIVSLIGRVPPDDAVSLLEDLSDRRFKRIMELLEPKKESRLRELLKHDRHSAGRLMTNEFFAFPMNATLAEVSAHIRDNPGIELTRRIYVLNDAGELIGFVPARNLIVNASYIPLRQVMKPLLHKVTVDTSRDEVVDLMERYNLPALPVVDETDHLVGVIAYEDAVEAMKDILDETIASIAGTVEDVSEHEPIIKRFFWRAPWLLVTVCAGLVMATWMSYFKDSEWYLLASFFVPLITGMSGNVGIQCSTLLVRSISTGEVTIGSRREAIVKEILIGLMIGLVFGFICGVIVYLLNIFGLHRISSDAIAGAMIVAFGVLGACMTATVLGSCSPFILAKFRIDPAVASGPIVTACNDVLSTLIFFLVAASVSHFLF